MKQQKISQIGQAKDAIAVIAKKYCRVKCLTIRQAFSVRRSHRGRSLGNYKAVKGF